jgi:hypothetical protein
MKAITGTIKFKIEVTLSKVMAFYALSLATMLDIKNGDTATAFMFTVPFVVTLVISKQYNDRKKESKINA